MHNETIVIIFPFPLGSGWKYVLSCLAEMDFDGSRYYMLNRVMLSSIGLWPYQNAWHIQIQRIFCLFCFISCIILQVSLNIITDDYYNYRIITIIDHIVFKIFFFLLSVMYDCIYIERLSVMYVYHIWIQFGSSSWNFINYDSLFHCHLEICDILGEN